MKEKKFTEYTYKILWVVIFISIIGLVISPLLPWIEISYTKISAQNPEGTEVNKKRSHIYIKFGEYNDTETEKLEAIENDIEMINIGLLLSLIFSMIGLLGVVLFRTGKNEKLSLILMLISVGILVFSLITIGYHIPLQGDIESLNTLYGDDMTVSRSFNYAPLVAGISTLICSIIYMIVLLPFAYSRFREPEAVEDDDDDRYKTPRADQDQSSGNGSTQMVGEMNLINRARQSEEEGHHHDAMAMYKEASHFEEMERVARELAKQYISQEEYCAAIQVYEDAEMWEQADNIRNLAGKEGQ